MMVVKPQKQMARMQLIETLQPARRGEIAAQPRLQKRQKIRATGEGFNCIKRWFTRECRQCCQQMVESVATALATGRIVGS